MSVTIDGTLGISGVAGSASAPALIGTDADSGYYINSANEPSASVNGTAVWNANSTFGFKNRIINGAMVIDQRNAGASVTITTTVYTLDRWQAVGNVSSKFSVQQNAGSVTPPTGFKNYLGATSLSAYSSGANDIFLVQQLVEGLNVVDLAFGTSGASSVTLSFKVYSSLTGTFGGSLRNASGSRSYPFTYSVASANTWTNVSVTIPGDTTGTWATDNNTGMQVFFDLGCGSNYRGTAGSWASANYLGATGSVSVVGTNGATFYITGVQLEKGSTATSFDFRSYGQELALCQRYYEKFDAGGTSGSYATWGSGYVGTSGTGGPLSFKFAVNKRANPTISQGGTLRVLAQSGTGTSPSCTDSYIGITGGYSNTTWTGSLTSGQACLIGASNDATAYVAFSSEL